MRLAHVFFALAVGLSVVSSSPPVHAEEHAPSASIDALLVRLGKHAESFEKMKTRASFTIAGRLDELDGAGRYAGSKEMVVDVKARGVGLVPDTEIVRYVEDGKDKTSDARAEAQKRKAEGKKPKGKRMRELHLPFLPSERHRYTFSIVERSATDPGRVRIAFTPHEIAENAFKGSAWVDERTGEVLSMGFSPSKTPSFVEHIDVTVEFGLETSLGRAPSKVTIDAKGGFLVFRKHYRGSATITNPHILP